MQSSDLAPKKIIKRKGKQLMSQTDLIGVVQTLSPFPKPSLSFKIDIVDFELGTYSVDCMPSEFNPLALCMDLSLGELSMGAAARASLLLEHGYIFPEFTATPVIH